MIFEKWIFFLFRKSILLINLFLDPSEGFFDSTDRQEIKFCVYGLIFMIFGAGRCSFMPILYLFMYFLHGGPIGVAPGTGVPLGIPGFGVPIGVAPGQGFPLGRSWSGPLGPLGPWDPPRLPGPLRSPRPPP